MVFCHLYRGPLRRRRIERELLFHRINGPIILTPGALGAVTELYLSCLGGSRLSDLGALGITLNGILIPIVVVIAWRYAVVRDVPKHIRWAVHSFLLINGVWVFRLFIFEWYLVNKGPKGNTETLDGSMGLFFSFAWYGLLMMVAELVFWAQRQTDQFRKWFVTMVMAAGCLMTAARAGIIVTTVWLPRIAL